MNIQRNTFALAVAFTFPSIEFVAAAVVLGMCWAALYSHTYWDDEKCTLCIPPYATQRKFSKWDCGLDLIQFFCCIAPNVHYLFIDFHINYEMFLVVAFYDGNGRSTVVITFAALYMYMCMQCKNEKRNPSLSVNEIEFHGLKSNINISVIYCIDFWTPLFLHICLRLYSMLKHICAETHQSSQQAEEGRIINTELARLHMNIFCIWSRF